MKRVRSLALLAVAIWCLTVAASGQAMARGPAAYPYTLLDPGTFGGPSSFVDLPGVPITREGFVLGTADTTARDPDFPSDDFHDGYVQHPFAWRGGRLSDLGALPPASENNSEIYGLNSHGVGAGVSENGRVDPLIAFPAQEATLYSHGRVTDLGTLGGYESGAWFIDAQGQVTGGSSNATADPSNQQSPYFPFFPWVAESRTFVWRDGVMRDIGTLGGADALPSDQNARGQIAGLSFTDFTPNPSTGIPTFHPFLWDDGRMRDLGSLGGSDGIANWLNDRGEVVGVSNLAGDDTAHPFLWKNGRMQDLGTLGDFGFASYINNRGDVTGGSFAPDETFHGFLWHDGKLIDLPPVGAAVHAFGNALNDRDQVVGNENDADFNEVIAALWSGGRGYDLNTLVAPSSFQMISADYITDQGEIFGHGVYTSGPNRGDDRVFALIRNPSVPLASNPTNAAPLPRSDVRHPLAGALYGASQDQVVARARQLMLSSPAMRSNAVAQQAHGHAGAVLASR